MPLPTDGKENREPLIAFSFKLCAAKTDSEGRPGTPVFVHCVFSGVVAEVLSGLLAVGVKQRLSKTAGLSVAVHDVGKVSPGYEQKYFKGLIQRYAPSLAGQCNFERNHADIGAAAVASWLGTDVRGSAVALAVASHHGSCKRSYPADDAEVNGGPAWAEERRKLYGELERYFNSRLALEPSVDAALQAGLTCVSDWIASDERFFPATCQSTEGCREAASQALRSCGFGTLPMRKGLSFRELFGFEPNATQRAFAETVTKPGVYILEAPMGAGKTEAALFAAYQLVSAGFNRGFYFALPTKLTSDRIHQRVEAFLKVAFGDDVRVRLAHGAAWLEEYGFGGEAMAPSQAWFHPAKRALLYPFAVGTIDQALLSVLNVKHSFVRLFGLAGKVVILDEVHSYDLYTGTLLDELVNRLCEVGCTVIILSATLTASRRRVLLGVPPAGEAASSYPLITGRAAGSGVAFAHPFAAESHRKVFLEQVPWKDAEAVLRMIDAARRGQCVVCILDTVARAQYFYKLAQSERREGDAFPLGLLHSRFPLARRLSLESTWMDRLGRMSPDRPKGCLLFATQVVEQSVDIDADWLVTELAPSDMLLQRIGRLWRHPSTSRPDGCRPVCTILLAGNPADCETKEDVEACFGKANGRVYPFYLLMRTAEAWRDRKSLALPDDIRPVLEATYAPREETKPVWKAALAELEKNNRHLRECALSASVENQVLPVMTDDEEGGQTRYGGVRMANVLLLQSVREDSEFRAKVVLPDGASLALDRGRPDIKATRALNEWVAPVPIGWIRERLGQKAPPWLKGHFGSAPFFALLEGGTAGAPGTLCDGETGEPTNLRYRDDLGVWREEADAGLPSVLRTGPAGDDDFLDESNW